MNFPVKAIGVSAGLLIAAATGAAFTELEHQSSASTTTVATAPAKNEPVSNSNAKQVYDDAKESVAFISAQTPEGEATGSGFVVSSDGGIVTNAHVVDGAQQVTVKLGTNGAAEPATVVASDTSKDLAVLRVDTGQALHPLTLADSSKVQVGDTVYAIGNPLGLDHTFTSGIVSALDRQIQAPDGTPIDGAIQTDAAINPGNSGGALLDQWGRVIGVNSQIASTGSTDGGQAGNVGIGFAIPSNVVADYIANPTNSAQADQSTTDGSLGVDPQQSPDGSLGLDPYTY